MRNDDSDLVDRLRKVAQTLQELPDYSSSGESRSSWSDGLLPEDISDALTRLEPEYRIPILNSLDPETAAYVMIELPTEIARSIVAELPDETVAHYLDILPMDDAVELREELDPERFEALLKVIPQEDASEIRRLLSYPQGSAGQLMTEDFLAVTPDSTMADVLAAIREAPDAIETVNYVYVLSGDGHLLGILTLRRVLRADPAALSRDVMNSDPTTAPVEMPQEEIARLLARYGFAAIPILDRRGRMLGIVTADDAQEILEEAATEDVLKLGAVSGDAEAYLSLPILELIKRRLPWLLILFVAEFFTGTVMRHYLPAEANEDPNAALSIVAKLTLFVPLLIGAGGNAGSQVTTTITRALALGEVRPKDGLRVLRRELMVSVVIGLVLGTVGFLRAWAKIPIIGWAQPTYLAVIVGCALPCIVIWAATVGSLLPIGAKRLGLDPAVMSAPFITTFVDATGLIIFFEIARAVVATQGLRF